MNGHCQLVQDPLGYVQPVQVVVKQLCRSTFILAGVGLFVCLFVCLGFNGTFSTNRLYRAVTVG